MSVVDNAIQQLFKNGCKIKKLWTNASITSSFAAQIAQFIKSLFHIRERGWA